MSKSDIGCEMMSLKHGYDYSNYPVMQLSVVEDGEAEAAIEISGANGGGFDYGATVIIRDKKIVGFKIKSYDIELEIPASIEAHDAILKALQGLTK